MKKFYAVIGNPPYQENVSDESDNKNFAPPIYNHFLDESYKVADIVEMIHPARFLFEAGNTPSDWNRKMLNDEHLKVEHYYQDSSELFPNTDIKGGVVVSYHDNRRKVGPIVAFTAFPELNSIRQKVNIESESDSMMSIIFTQNRFNLDALYADRHDLKKKIGSEGKDKRFRNNIFDYIDEFRDKPKYSDDIEVLGVVKNKRVTKFFPRKYFDFNHENITSYKVVLPRANGKGTLEDVFSTPVILGPYQGYTQTFLGVGAFNTMSEAESALKYVKSKFLRTTLSILKITQHNERPVWKYVPIQDFTPNSDIDWSKSIPEIDMQLYKKYSLDEKEIEFIESHVKEMT